MTELTPALVETGAGFTVFFKGAPLYPTHDPKASTEKKAASVCPSPNTLYLIPSPLLGYGLDTLLSGLPDSSLLVCVEREETLGGLCAGRLPSTLLDSPACIFLTTDSCQVVLDTVVQAGIHRFRRVVLLALNRGFQLHRRFYEELRDGLLDLVQNHWRNRMTILNLGRLWAGNLLLNLAEVDRAGDAADMTFDRPVLLLGAGASLEFALPFALRMRENIRIVAVDTALPVLFKSGLVPDLVVAADAQWANLGDFVGAKGAGFALAADLTTYPAIIRGHTGALYLFLSNFTRLGLLRQMADSGLAPLVIPPLGSVGVMAYYLVRKNFDGPLLIAGLDFHYKATKTHSRGAPGHDRMLRECSRMHPPAFQPAALYRPTMPGHLTDGKTVQTDAVLLEYNRQFCVLSAGDRLVFDLAEAGLRRPIPRLGLTQAELLVRSFDATRPARIGRSREPTPGFNPGRGRRDVFLASLENDLLDTAARLCAWSPTGSSDDQILFEMLDRLDFLYFDFPDYPPRPQLSPASCARLLASARWYLSRTRRARANPRRS
jgi:hypothetical protein